METIKKALPKLIFLVLICGLISLATWNPVFMGGVAASFIPADV